MTVGRDFPKIIPTNLLEEYDMGRLVDEGVYFYNASLQGKAERYQRGITSHTIHVWWARRPHNAMLPLVYASVTKKMTQKTMEIMQQLSFQADQNTAITQVNQQINHKTVPRVLDIFGGGGTIPQAAAALGYETYAIDINPLAVFVQKTFLEFYPVRGLSRNELKQKLELYGTQILQQLRDRTDQYFPDRLQYKKQETEVVAYIWSYLYQCSNCDYQFYLSNRPWISKKMKNKPTKGTYIALAIKEGESTQSIELLNVEQSASKSYQKSYEKQSPLTTRQCPSCNDEFQPDITKCKDKCLIKIISHGYGKGKSFELVKQENQLDTDHIVINESRLVEQLAIDPDTFPQIPKWSGISNPTLYGIENYYNICNPRQRLVLLELLQLLKECHHKLIQQENKEIAVCLITLLSALIDQLVDWNCRITMWISQNLQPGRAFSGPGIPMYWDYAEIDPLQQGPANLHKKLQRIIQGIDNLPTHIFSATIKQELEFDDTYFDAVITDPPYYDNLFYSILADAIYCWKYQLLHPILPDVFQSTTTQQDQELVAASQRHHGNHLLAHQFYSKQMAQALQEVERVLKTDGVLAFVYSHKSIMGWLALVEAFSPTGLLISSVQPLTIERKARPRAMNAESVDTCLVFVAHKLDKSKMSIQSVEELFEQYPDIIQTIRNSLQPLEFEEYDIGLTAFANGVAILANFGFSDQQYLLHILVQLEGLTQQHISSFKLSHRHSL